MILFNADYGIRIYVIIFIGLTEKRTYSVKRIRFLPFYGSLILQRKTFSRCSSFTTTIRQCALMKVMFWQFEKICYDKAGNLPNKGRNFNTQTWGKIVYFLFVWLVGIGFRQNLFRVLPNFGDFGAKMSFFHYIINQKRNNFIKHCPTPRVPRSRWYQRCVSI